MQVAAWRTWLCDIWERGVARKEALAYALWTLSPSLLPGLLSFSSSPSPTWPQRGFLPLEVTLLTALPALPSTPRMKLQPLDSALWVQTLTPLQPHLPPFLTPSTPA